jgi:hypothetical protein
MFDTVGESGSSNRRTVGVGMLLLASGITLNYLFERHRLFASWGDLFYPTSCFFLFLTGVVLSIGGVARGSIRRLLPYVFWIVIPVTLLYIGFYAGVQFIQTGADRLGECPGLDQAAASSNVIPESKWRPGQPAVGCGVERRGMFLSYYNTVGVHGVTEVGAQQRVVDNLTDYYRRVHTHPVTVMFYETENWTTRQGKNGVTFGSRGPEKLIRVVNIG